MWLNCLSGVLFLILLETDPARGQSRSNCTCGLTNPTKPKIYGGETAGVNEFPYMALVIAIMDNEISLCGGSIITAYHVLTAAHCTTGVNASQIDIVVGEHDLSREDETRFTKTIKAAKVSIHPSYDGYTNDNDIAIVTTSEKIPFSEAVGPICLPTTQTDIIGELVQVTGWGRLSENGNHSDVLMKLDTKIVPFTICDVTLDFVKGENTSTRLCTFRSLYQSAYRGDSGGPLTLLDPFAEVRVQVGVESGGVFSLPSVATDVGAFLPWIQQQISETAPLTENARTCSIV